MTTPVSASSARNDSNAQARMSFSSVEIRVLFAECMDGTGKVAGLFANGMAQIPVTVLVSTDGCTVKEIGLVTKKLATDMYQGTIGHGFPNKLHMKLSNSVSSRKNWSFPSNQLYPVSGVQYDHCKTFLLTTSERQQQMREKLDQYELMAYVSLSGYRPGYGADAEEVTLFSFMSAENSNGNEITMDSFVLLQVKQKPLMRFYTTYLPQSGMQNTDAVIDEEKEEGDPDRLKPSFVMLGQITIHCDYGYNSVYPLEIREQNDGVIDRSYPAEEIEIDVIPSESEHGITVREAANGSFRHPTRLVKFSRESEGVKGQLDTASVILLHSNQDTAFVESQVTRASSVFYQTINQGGLATISFFRHKLSELLSYPNSSFVDALAFVVVADTYGDMSLCFISGFEISPGMKPTDLKSCPIRVEYHLLDEDGLPVVAASPTHKSMRGIFKQK